MKLKSTTYYWLAVAFGGVGMGAAMGAEGTAHTPATRSIRRIRSAGHDDGETVR